MLLQTSIYGAFDIDLSEKAALTLAVIREMVPRKKLVLERDGLRWLVPLKCLVLDLVPAERLDEYDPGQLRSLVFE